MTRTYTHLELNKEVKCLAGYYTPDKELRLKSGNREILAVVGRAVVDASCCGVANWVYAIVPGYVESWQSEKNPEGLPVSRVEPVIEEDAKTKTRDLLKKAENVTYVEFW